MKIKTSITLSEELLKAIDEYGREYHNRSEFIEEAVRFFVRQLIRRQQDARDFEIINHRADYLNQEAMDVLTYQVEITYPHALWVEELERGARSEFFQTKR